MYGTVLSVSAILLSLLPSNLVCRPPPPPFPLCGTASRDIFSLHTFLIRSYCPESMFIRNDCSAPERPVRKLLAGWVYSTQILHRFSGGVVRPAWLNRCVDTGCCLSCTLQGGILGSWLAWSLRYGTLDYLCKQDPVAARAVLFLSIDGNQRICPTLPLPIRLHIDIFFIFFILGFSSRRSSAFSRSFHSPPSISPHPLLLCLRLLLLHCRCASPNSVPSAADSPAIATAPGTAS